MSTTRSNIERFVLKHKLIFEDQSEVGFCRPCVGLISKAGAYLDINPYVRTQEGVEDAFPYDSRLYPPLNDVPDQYHKHDCLCVLVHDDDHDEAIRQLSVWIDYLESRGELETRQYKHRHDNDIMTKIHGYYGWALVFKDYVNTDMDENSG